MSDQTPRRKIRALPHHAQAGLLADSPASEPNLAVAAARGRSLGTRQGARLPGQRRGGMDEPGEVAWPCARYDRCWHDRRLCSCLCGPQPFPAHVQQRRGAAPRVRDRARSVPMNGAAARWPEWGSRAQFYRSRSHPRRPLRSPGGTHRDRPSCPHGSWRAGRPPPPRCLAAPPAEHDSEQAETPLRRADQCRRGPRGPQRSQWPRRRRRSPPI